MTGADALRRRGHKQRTLRALRASRKHHGIHEVTNRQNANAVSIANNPDISYTNTGVANTPWICETHAVGV